MGKRSSSQKKRERGKFKREKRRRETEKKRAQRDGSTNRDDDRQLEYARDLVETAWGTDVPAAREALAREALTAAPNYPDALILLAQLPSASATSAIELCQQALATARTQLDRDDSANLDDAAALGTAIGRSGARGKMYLRARMALAEALVMAGNRELAIVHLEQLAVVDVDEHTEASRRLSALKETLAS